jgi:hypothetical protein
MERKLTAILSADVHGYSRLIGEDEEATIHTLRTRWWGCGNGFSTKIWRKQSGLLPSCARRG